MANDAGRPNSIKSSIEQESKYRRNVFMMLDTAIMLSMDSMSSRSHAFQVSLLSPSRRTWVSIWYYLTLLYTYIRKCTCAPTPNSTSITHTVSEPPRLTPVIMTTMTSGTPHRPIVVTANRGHNPCTPIWNHTPFILKHAPLNSSSPLQPSSWRQRLSQAVENRSHEI